MNEPLRRAIERIHECMRLGLGGNQIECDTELAKLVEQFGEEFVCQHACEETWAGGKECAAGHCERRDGHGAWDTDAEGDVTCRQAAQAYIECCMGRPAPN